MGDLGDFGHLVPILSTHDENVGFKLVFKTATEFSSVSRHHGPIWAHREGIDNLKFAAGAVEPLAPNPSVLGQVQPMDNPMLVAIAISKVELGEAANVEGVRCFIARHCPHSDRLTVLGFVDHSW